MKKERLLELAGFTKEEINNIVEYNEVEVRNIDFEKVKDALRKKYGDSKDIDGMSKMELTKAAASLGIKPGTL